MFYYQMQIGYYIGSSIIHPFSCYPTIGSLFEVQPLCFVRYESLTACTANVNQLGQMIHHNVCPPSSSLIRLTRDPGLARIMKLMHPFCLIAYWEYKYCTPPVVLTSSLTDLSSGNLPLAFQIENCWWVMFSIPSSSIPWGQYLQRNVVLIFPLSVRCHGIGCGYLHQFDKKERKKEKYAVMTVG